MTRQPTISCICVTQNAIAKLERVIACFHEQSYKSRELIVVGESSNIDLMQIASDIEGPQVKVVQVLSEPKHTLGQLRNIGISKAQGAYFCQWDDDDWYHVDRLKLQVKSAMQFKKVATILNYLLIYDESNSMAYFCKRLWEGSLLCKLKFWEKVKYPDMSRGEDAAYLNSLIYFGNVIPINNPNLYIYTYHGENTWDRGHFESIFDRSQNLSAKSAELISDTLKANSSVSRSSLKLSSSPLLEELDFLYLEKMNLKSSD